MRKEVRAKFTKRFPRIGKAASLDLSVLIVPLRDSLLEINLNLAKSVLEVV
jgi:hypothetical protein